MLLRFQTPAFPYHQTSYASFLSRPHICTAKDIRKRISCSHKFECVEEKPLQGRNWPQMMSLGSNYKKSKLRKQPFRTMDRIKTAHSRVSWETYLQESYS